tara:strand:+ start:14550 stop:15563 length:1014 start_codon:yes stop_codon:yes gene_type:complete
MTYQVLITGGAGYVGSHLCVGLHNAGFEPIILDNFSNSYKDVIDRIYKIINKEIPVIKGDIRDYDLLDNLFKRYNIKTVIHCAALKSVNESLSIPIKYYDNNVAGSINLIKAMQNNNIKSLIFSSTAAVYGNSKIMPLVEDTHRAATNPYGHTKIMMENVFMDLNISDLSKWKIGILRYFNPIGAHESGFIGENSLKTPSNIMPNIIQAAKNELKHINIYGDDYDTKDGTCLRDYIHIMDLVDGHIATLHYLNLNQEKLFIANLGTGKGISVLELIETFAKVNNIKVPYKISSRRDGDIAICYADPSYANKVINWHASRSLSDMCKDSWNFSNNSFT